MMMMDTFPCEDIHSLISGSSARERHHPHHHHYRQQQWWTTAMQFIPKLKDAKK
jgi:hypothetical protein